MSVFSRIRAALATWDLRDKLLVTIGATAILWYYVSITCLGFGLDAAMPTGTAPAAEAGKMTMRQFMEMSTTTIAGTLATYVGMVLGLGHASETARKMSLSRGIDARAAAAANPGISTQQQIAAWAYFLSLLYALGIWGWTFSIIPDPTVQALAQSLLGLFGGVLAVLLNSGGARP